MIRYNLSPKFFYRLLYEYYYLIYVGYALQLIVFLIGVVYIERQRCLLNSSIRSLSTTIAQQKKENDSMEQKAGLLNTMHAEYTAQRHAMQRLSLKEICVLLFDQHSEYAINLISYCYQLTPQAESYRAQVNIEGDYASIINFCKAIHDKFSVLRCTIESLMANQSGLIEAKLIFTLYKEVLCIDQ